MSSYCNVGTIEFEKPLSDSLKGLAEKLWSDGLGRSVYVDEQQIEFQDYYTSYLDEDIDELLKQASKDGNVANGTVECFDGPDTDRNIFVKDGECVILSRDDAWRESATDEELIAELESRGYSVERSAEKEEDHDR